MEPLHSEEEGGTVSLNARCLCECGSCSFVINIPLIRGVIQMIGSIRQRLCEDGSIVRRNLAWRCHRNKNQSLEFNAIRERPGNIMHLIVSCWMSRLNYSAILLSCILAVLSIPRVGTSDDTFSAAKAQLLGPGICHDRIMWHCQWHVLSGNSDLCYTQQWQACLWIPVRLEHIQKECRWGLQNFSIKIICNLKCNETLSLSKLFGCNTWCGIVLAFHFRH